MIGRLLGEIIEKQPPHILLDVNGVGYELQAPMSTFYELPNCGEIVLLFTHLLVREDAHTLYAFKHTNDRGMFRNLLKVNGVGAKMALAILSGMDTHVFKECIHNGDAESLIRLPGVGRKTAERLIIDMRDRLDKNTEVRGPASSNNSIVHKQSPVEDAVSALISLGYKPNDASRMVGNVETQDQNSEDIIRQALKTSLA